MSKVFKNFKLWKFVHRRCWKTSKTQRIPSFSKNGNVLHFKRFLRINSNHYKCKNKLLSFLSLGKIAQSCIGTKK